MARAVTINNLAEYKRIPDNEIEQAIRENILYADDLFAALALARKRGLASCTLCVSRTPTPGSDDEVVDISVRGMARAADFNAAVKHIISMGPDDEEPG